MRNNIISSLWLRGALSLVALVFLGSTALAQAPSETPSTTPTTPPPTTPAPAAAPPASAAPAAQNTGGPKDKGVVFQLKMGGNLLSVMGGGLAAWLNSSFMVGYKMGNLTLGLGLEMTYNDDNLPNMEPDPIESSTSMVLFQPTVEYYLAMSNPLAFYLSGGLHIGFVNMHADPGEDVTDAMIGFHAGVGMRFFFHPRFAVGIEGGIRAVWMMIENDEDMDEDDNHTGTMSIYGSAVLTAIW